jgi:hypothetical protein
MKNDATPSACTGVEPPAEPDSAVSATATIDLREGMQVRLSGLVAAAMNGTTGILIGRTVNSRGRWRVQLADGSSKKKRVVALKPENLIIVEAQSIVGHDELIDADSFGSESSKGDTCGSCAGGRGAADIAKLATTLTGAAAPVVTIKGSRGNAYEVNVVERTCSCPHFRYRLAGTGKKCSHLVAAFSGESASVAPQRIPSDGAMPDKSSSDVSGGVVKPTTTSWRPVSDVDVVKLKLRMFMETGGDTGQMRFERHSGVNYVGTTGPPEYGKEDEAYQKVSALLMVACSCEALPELNSYLSPVCPFKLLSSSLRNTIFWVEISALCRNWTQWVQQLANSTWKYLEFLWRHPLQRADRLM